MATTRYSTYLPLHCTTTFDTIARNDCNVSKDDVALCLTHQSRIKITDTYIKPDYSRIDEVVRKVVALL